MQEQNYYWVFKKISFYRFKGSSNFVIWDYSCCWSWVCVIESCSNRKLLVVSPRPFYSKKHWKSGVQIPLLLDPGNSNCKWILALASWWNFPTTHLYPKNHWQCTCRWTKCGRRLNCKGPLATNHPQNPFSHKLGFCSAHYRCQSPVHLVWKKVLPLVS